MLRLKSISFKNYKGFSEGKIEFKALNFLIGANSSGKSSALKLLLLLSQSISTKTASPFLLKGPLLSAGEKDSLFKNYNLKSELEFTFELSTATDFSSILASCIRTYRQRFRADLYSLPEDSADKSLILSLRRRLLIGNSADDFAFLDGTIEAAKFLSNHAQHIQQDETDLTEKPVLIDYLTARKLLESLKLLKGSKANKISYIVRHDKLSDLLHISQITILHGKKELLHVTLHGKYAASDKIRIAGFNQNFLKKNHRSIVDAIDARSFKVVRRNSDGVTPLSRAFLNNPLGTLVASMISRVSSFALESLNPEKLRHVSPLRAYPRHYYLIDNDTAAGSTDNNNESERIIKLLREHKNLATTVNSWLEKLGHRVELNRIHESIYKILISHSEHKTDLTNVGFGLSQILPVLIEPLMANDGDIVIIQQPEIHLHPKAQSILGDFFAWIANTKNISVFIETHSEYMLRRIRTRIVQESQKDSVYALDSSHVTISNFEKNKMDCIMNRSVVSAQSGFNWPKDFIENEVYDLIEYMNATAQKAQTIAERSEP